MVESNGLSVYLFFIMLLHKRGRRQIAKAGLLADSVIENFDVLGDFKLGISTGGETTVVDQFVFE